MPYSEKAEGLFFACLNNRSKVKGKCPSSKFLKDFRAEKHAGMATKEAAEGQKRAVRVHR